MSEIASTGDFVWTGGDPPPDDHTLNVCLARVIEVEVTEGKDGNDTVWFLTEEWVEEGWDEFTEWNPLHDANQMELVEAWLREHNCGYITGWSRQESIHWAELRNLKKSFWSCDPSKKRAFALAIWEMMKARKETV